MTPRKKRIIIVGVVVVSILLTIEGVARFILGLGTPPLSVVDPDIEYLFKPNQDVMRFGNRQMYNTYGMRNPDFPMKKPSTEYRIVCFGDSVLNGGNLTDQSQLATTQLERRLADEWGLPVVVANVSAGSWGPPNMLAYARKYGLFDADSIVVQLSSHDIGDVPTFDPLNPFTHPTRSPCCATWEGLTRYVPRYIPALKPLLQPGADQESPLDSATPEQAERMIKEAHASSLQALSDLHALATEEGADFLVVLHAERDEIETGVYASGHDRFVQWARTNQVALLNLGPPEAESLKEGIDPYRKNDNIHLSDAGQRILEEQLYTHFKHHVSSPDHAAF